MRKLDAYNNLYTQVSAAQHQHQHKHHTVSSATSSASSSPTSVNTTTTTPSMLLFPPPPPPPHATKSPEYYPSPPESLPDTCRTIANTPLNPVDFKGAAYGLTPLMLFVMSRSSSKANANNSNSNSIDIVDTLLAHGADLNAQSLDGETALHMAARCGLRWVCERLLTHGASLDVRDIYGRNALHTAVCSGQLEVARLVLTHCSLMISSSHGNGVGELHSDHADKYDVIDAKTSDELSETALIMAARLALNALVQLLVDFNATINATDGEGRSALHWCAKVNNYEGAMVLLRAGANVNMQDNEEKTPLSSALGELCTHQVVEVLNSYFFASKLYTDLGKNISP